MASLSFPTPRTILDALASLGVTVVEFAAYLDRRRRGIGAITPTLEELSILYLEAQHAEGNLCLSSEK